MSHKKRIGPTPKHPAMEPYELKALTALARHYLNYKYITSEQEALEAVAKDGFLLRYVRHQTAKICSAAVNENMEAIMHVHPHIFDALESDLTTGEPKQNVDTQSTNEESDSSNT